MDTTPYTHKIIGIVGGMGPSATVDLMDKIIRCTPAATDQQHLKMVIEHNPQIPDRTEHLLGDGPDPTDAIYATCKKLESAGTDMIAIPCNTAHAFFARIQSRLSIPIVNMLQATVEFLQHAHPDIRKVGLLATSGTIKSGVYRDVFEATDYDLLVPEQGFQQKLMNVIYGDKGIKAGYTDGECLEEFQLVSDHLTNKGAEIIILGCTELPLLKLNALTTQSGEEPVVFVDPTWVLARKCVDVSMQVNTRI